jgi:hypothetical protein
MTSTQTAPAHITATYQIRAKFPRLRRSGPVAIVHSGSKCTIFACLCGASHSAESTRRGRSAKHVSEFFAAHKDCAQSLASRLPTLTLSIKNARHGRCATSFPVLSEATN